MVAISHVMSTLFSSAALSGLGGHLAAFQGLTHCDISNDAAQLNVMPINNAFTAPSNLTPNFVGLAFGVQNYTCSPSNNFTSTGAVAELFDVSCMVNSTIFDDIQTPLFEAWNHFPSLTIQDFIDFFHAIGNPPEILAQHYFIPNPVTGQGLSPKWDFTSSGNPKFFGDEKAFVVVKGKNNIPAPNSTVDIAWLETVNIGGDAGGAIADEVLRTSTVGGQPPTSCEHGKTQDISVKYASLYWFFGGQLGGPQ